MNRRLALTIAAVLVVCLAGESFASLSDRLAAESRLPAYLNRDEAVMVFDRQDTAETITVELSFLEQNTEHVPAAPMTLVLSGPSQRYEHPVDISSWPDGEYKAFIKEVGVPDGEVFVRAVLKQTLASPEPPQGTIDVKGLTMLFLDDWYIEQSADMVRQVKPAEMIPVEPWKANPDYYRYSNFVREHYIDINGDLTVEVSASNASGVDTLRYWVRTNDMENWEILENPLPRHPDCLAIDIGGMPVTQTMPPEGTEYRYYDQAVDGEVDFSQVHVYRTGGDHDVKWGDIEMSRFSGVAVWEKSPTLHLQLGDPITEHGIDALGVPPVGEIGTWSRTNDNYGPPRWSADGSTLRFWQTRRVPRYEPFRVHYDNLLSDRIMITWSSTDGFNWTPTLFNPPTPDDPWSTQDYRVDMWWQEDKQLEMAYRRVYDCQLQQIKIDIVYSRDGILWHKFEGSEPFLGNGEFGEWNFGFSRALVGNNQRVTFGDYYYEPMSGINGLHLMYLIANGRVDRSTITAGFMERRFGGRMMGENGLPDSPIWDWYESLDNLVEETRNTINTAGIVRYKKDRWVAVSPKNHTGIITTKVFNAPAHTLTLNAKTGDEGFIRVEVLDASGNPLEGYTGINSAVFTGDRTDALLHWSGGQQQRLPQTPFKLRFVIRHSELYAISFNESFEGGAGEPDDPYRVSTFSQLKAVNNKLSAHYRLVNDIEIDESDTGAAVLAPQTVGDATTFAGQPFTGSLDGNGFAIKGLNVNGGDNHFIGLFGSIGTGGVVRNLRLENADVSGQRYIGVLAGENHGTIDNCHGQGKATAQVDAGGGLVGVNYGAIRNSSAAVLVTGQTNRTGGLVGINSGTIERCSAAGTVVATGERIGGLVGWSEGMIMFCAATGDVQAPDARYVAGLVGLSRGTGVFNSYATGSVSGDRDVGGLVGLTTSNGAVMNCYSTGAVSGADLVGGLIGRVGSDSGPVRNSFWDTETSGQDTSPGGTGKTTAQMKTFSTFTNAGWNFVTIWMQRQGEYPLLRWQALSADLDGSGRVNILDLRLFLLDWLTDDHYLLGDINNDGIVDFQDFAMLAHEWLL